MPGDGVVRRADHVSHHDPSVGIATGPQDGATSDTVERLRTEVIPCALTGSPAHAYIGGQTANFADVGARVNDRLPVFIGAVLALSFLLLMLVFRPIFVPLKAVVLNLLSIGASYLVASRMAQPASPDHRHRGRGQIAGAPGRSPSFGLMKRRDGRC